MMTMMVERRRRQCRPGSRFSRPVAYCSSRSFGPHRGPGPRPGRAAASAAIVVAVNATVKLSFCPPPPPACCLHVLLLLLLLLLRLFALKILFIAIARICTKISYIETAYGMLDGIGGGGKGNKADNEIVVTQFGNVGQKEKERIPNI